MDERRMDEIEARAKAATPGPWFDGRYCDEVCNGEYDIATTRPHNNFPNEFDDNANFIAHARQDVPDLLAEVERLRAVLNEIRTLPGTAAEVGTMAVIVAENALKGGDA